MDALTSLTALPWLALLALGAVHGINPAMGWLFAVALGLQERDRRQVWGALGPLALGHGLAVAVAVAATVAFGLLVPLAALKWIVAALLVGLGVAQLARHRHPRLGGMRVGRKKLTLWSFLMATAHGAGLMVLPFLLGASRSGGHVGDALGATAGGGGASGGGAAGVAAGASHVAGGVGHAAGAPGAGGAVDASAAHDAAGHAAHGVAALAGLPREELVGIAATLVHTAGYLLVTGLIAVIVYEKLGLRLLRTAWINLNLLWAVALIATGLLTPLL